MLRKATLLSAVAGAALFASSASADVFVFGDVDKDVDIQIRERLIKDKFIDIDVVIRLNPTKAAQSTATFNQRITARACENCAEKIATINGSINGNVGLTSTNQAAGNNNNQGNVIAFAFDLDQPPPPGDPNGPRGFAHAEAVGSQFNNENQVNTVNIVFRDAGITGSIVGNNGITSTNQSAGNMTNQANVVSVAVSRGIGVALADEALGQFVIGNRVNEANVSKQAVILGSINGNTGITQTNQTTGTVLNQANVVALSVAGF